MCARMLQQHPNPISHTQTHFNITKEIIKSYVYLFIYERIPKLLQILLLHMIVEEGRKVWQDVGDGWWVSKDENVVYEVWLERSL